MLDNEQLLNFKYLNGSEAKEGSIQFHLAGLSTALAKSIYEMITNTNATDKLNVDPIMIDELMNCYLMTMDCRFFRSASAAAVKPPNYPPSMYVGVGQGPYSMSQFTGQTLAFLTGTKTYQYIWMRGSPDSEDNTSVCMQTNMNFTEAVSPAFQIDGKILDLGPTS
ncbi:hypothetical protein B566_EDAN006394 [Ephemera danica]|nr:hypothetical protein B566_EDAN006394 [Ephemera danica]